MRSGSGRRAGPQQARPPGCTRRVRRPGAPRQQHRTPPRPHNPDAHPASKKQLTGGSERGIISALTTPEGEPPRLRETEWSSRRRAETRKRKREAASTTRRPEAVGGFLCPPEEAGTA